MELAISLEGRLLLVTKLSSHNWYHETLQHPGATRLINTIRANFHLPKLHDLAKNLTKSYDICQFIKDFYLHEGQLAEKLAKLNPWEEVPSPLVRDL